MELDDLKRLWQDCDKRLNTLHLNTRLLRSSILGNGDAWRLELLDTRRRRTGEWMLQLASAGEEMVEELQASLVRVLRRRGVLRG